MAVVLAPDTPSGQAGWVGHDLDALRALFRETDEALDGWTCDLSSDCCHFERTGREPYLWPNEWELLRKAIAAKGGVRAASSRAGNAKHLPLLERRCPLLDPQGRCGVYESRPFGCRTFFCDRGVGPTRKPPRAELAAIGRRIADLAQRAEPRCDGPRTISSLLAARK